MSKAIKNNLGRVEFFAELAQEEIGELEESMKHHIYHLLKSLQSISDRLFGPEKERDLLCALDITERAHKIESKVWQYAIARAHVHRINSVLQGMRHDAEQPAQEPKDEMDDYPYLPGIVGSHR